MAKIKNFNDLTVTPLRKMALEIAEAGLEAIDTKTVIAKNVHLEEKSLVVQGKTFSLKEINRIFIVGVGKCSLEAAGALEEILGKRLNGGIVLDVHQGSLNKVKAYKGTHPLPSPQNIEITKKIIALLEDLNKDDLVIVIVSGGGSVLLCQPESHTCVEERKISECLLKSGADIKKINTVRKHLSLARGGALAKYAYPAKVISLIFSDVLDNQMEFIASGPTVKDTTTVKEAEKILKQYKILKKCGVPKIKLIETPKDNKYFKNVDNFLIVSNKIALNGMLAVVKRMKLKGEICSFNFSGEARKLGEKFIKKLDNYASKTVLLFGGESTVVVRGKGKGGRNQELVLSALRFIKNGQVLIAFGSDGRDNTDVAGAICDIITKEKAKNLGLDLEKYLKDNNSYNFFAETGDYLFTGDTGSNVSDLIIAIKE